MHVWAWIRRFIAGLVTAWAVRTTTQFSLQFTAQFTTEEATMSQQSTATAAHHGRGPGERQRAILATHVAPR